LLAENEVDIRQTSLEAFSYEGFEADDIEEVNEEAFDAVTGNG
jgi:hypothetical protein